MKSPFVVLGSVACVLGLSALSAPALAYYSLGDAAGYGFIAGPNTHSIQISNSTFYGNGATDVSNPSNNYVQFSSGTIYGNFDFVGSDNQNSLGSGTLMGSVNANISAVYGAYNGITSLSNQFAGETGTSFNGSGAITASNGTQDSAGNYVFTTTANQFLNGGALTINGSSSQYVVINVTGNNNVQLKNLLTLTGGITDDHVFINITGSGQQVGGNTNGGVINGVFTALYDKINIDNTTIDGRVFGGGSGDFQLVSGLTLDTPVLPEPAFVQMGSLLALGGLGYALRTLKNRIA